MRAYGGSTPESRLSLRQTRRSPRARTTLAGNARRPTPSSIDLCQSRAFTLAAGSTSNDVEARHERAAIGGQSRLDQPFKLSSRVFRRGHGAGPPLVALNDAKSITVHYVRTPSLSFAKARTLTNCPAGQAVANARSPGAWSVKLSKSRYPPTPSTEDGRTIRMSTSGEPPRRVDSRAERSRERPIRNRASKNVASCARCFTTRREASFAAPSAAAGEDFALGIRLRSALRHGGR